jgi:hypothetical protein
MDIPENIAVYYTDGYIYADIMGQKVKTQYAYEDFEKEFADLLSGFDMGDLADMEESFSAVSAGMIKSIEKFVSEENIVYTVKMAADPYDDYSADLVVNVLFTPDGKLDSVNLSVKLELGDMSELLGDYYVEIQMNFKITAGNGVGIEFPDFSGYIETDEDFSFDSFDIPGIMSAVMQ